MTTADDPQADAPAPGAGVGIGGLTTQTHGQALSGTGLRTALFAQWGREKRRNALRQRYGEEAGALLDDGETALQYNIPED
jgi:hypothetical protein